MFCSMVNKKSLYRMYFTENYFCGILGLSVFLVLLKVIVRLTCSISRSNVCLVGKTVLITGGNSGLGYQIALALAARGARVIIADRDDATASIKQIAEETNNWNLVYKYVDLASLNSVREFAKTINAEENRLDILINNAGIAMSDEYSLDGLQLVMHTNHFGPFLLTHLLIGLLKKSAPSRIIFVSSILSFIGHVTPDNINEKAMIPVDYNKSKLMNIITSNIFAKKLEGSGVTSNAAYPGLVCTPIFQRIGGNNTRSLSKLLMYKIVLPLLGKTAREGAQTPIECALSKKLEKVSGKFFVECRSFLQPPQISINSDKCMKLWQKSEELVSLEESEKL